MEDNKAEPHLPDHLEKARNFIGVGFKKISNPIGSYGARTYASLGVDNSLDLDTFRNECSISLQHCSPEQIIFDIVNVDAPIANALRRILLVEVPSIAIEIVRFHNNTSVMHDEMFAHRLGLVPLKIDPRPFDVREKGDEISYRNTVKFRLKVICERNRTAPNDAEAPPSILYNNHKVLSSHIEYVPFPNAEADQVDLFSKTPPAPVDNDILLCKLRPGQEIDVDMEATKNIGKEHAKWSPVCTAAYRMLPEIRLRKELRGELASELVKKCPAKVFDIEDDVAVVSRPRDCTMCRECIRLPEWNERVELMRRRDHFLFDIESTGSLDASILVVEALSILMEKCDLVRKELDHALERRNTHLSDEEEVDFEICG